MTLFSLVRDGFGLVGALWRMGHRARVLAVRRLGQGAPRKKDGAGNAPRVKFVNLLAEYGASWLAPHA
jgi:hypothetical protein